MQEPLAQNNDPVNVAAKAALVKVKETPSEGRLHALQLAHWALESGKIEARDYMLAEFVQALYLQGSPEWGMQVLFVQMGEEYEDEELGEPEEMFEPVNMEEGMTPVELAAEILENISMSLAILDPNYMDADRLNAMR
jgi:hypothetical protein